jgi:ribosomal protein S25
VNRVLRKDRRHTESRWEKKKTELDGGIKKQRKKGKRKKKKENKEETKKTTNLDNDVIDRHALDELCEMMQVCCASLVVIVVCAQHLDDSVTKDESLDRRWRWHVVLPV